MNFLKISVGPDGAARYINVDQIATLEDTGEDGCPKLKMSNGDMIPIGVALREQILAMIKILP